MQPNVGRLSTFESIWEAWCDSIRVLIGVLPDTLTSPRCARPVRTSIEKTTIRLVQHARGAYCGRVTPSATAGDGQRRNIGA